MEIECSAMGCDEVRVWSKSEQEYFHDKGYEAPKYCKTHSQQRRQERFERENKMRGEGVGH